MNGEQKPTHNPLMVGQSVYFTGKNLPYIVRATSPRFAIVSRSLDREEDEELLEWEVERTSYFSEDEAFEACKDDPVYSILDFENDIRGTDNLIFGIFDYFDADDCKTVIKMLEAENSEDESMEISHRNQTDIYIDWQRTEAKGGTSL